MQNVKVAHGKASRGTPHTAASITDGYEKTLETSHLAVLLCFLWHCFVFS